MTRSSTASSERVEGEAEERGVVFPMVLVSGGERRSIPATPAQIGHGEELEELREEEGNRVVLAVRQGRLGFEIPVLDCTVAELRRGRGSFSGTNWRGKWFEEGQKREGNSMVVLREAEEVTLYRLVEEADGMGSGMVVVALRCSKGQGEGASVLRASWRTSRGSRDRGRRTGLTGARSGARTCLPAS